MSRRSASYFVLHTKRRQHGLPDGGDELRVMSAESLAMREAAEIIYAGAPGGDDDGADQALAERVFSTLTADLVEPARWATRAAARRAVFEW